MSLGGHSIYLTRIIQWKGKKSFPMPILIPSPIMCKMLPCLIHFVLILSYLMEVAHDCQELELLSFVGPNPMNFWACFGLSWDIHCLKQFSPRYLNLSTTILHSFNLYLKLLKSWRLDQAPFYNRTWCENTNLPISAWNIVGLSPTNKSFSNLHEVK